MQRFLGFLLAAMMAATAVAANDLTLVTPESELTTVQTQSNEFPSSSPQVKGPLEVTVSFDLRDIDHIDDEDYREFELLENELEDDEY